MANALAKLFWHLDQTPRHFWIPFFYDPSPKLKAIFPTPLEDTGGCTGHLPCRGDEKVAGLVTGPGGRGGRSITVTERSPDAEVKTTSRPAVHLLYEHQSPQLQRGHSGHRWVTGSDEAQMTYEEIHYKL